MRKAIERLSSILKRRDGASALEFALLIVPFSVLIFVIIDISLIYFVDTALDAALHKTSRKVRVGYALANNWTIKEFKADLCANITVSFGCTSNLIVRAVVVSDMSSVSYLASTKNGILNVSDSFNIGKTGDYVLVQAFLPWNPVLTLYSFSTATLADGTYILGSSDLFKNEPFQ
jgi:Flp pilus assembly protein TadG